MYFRRMRGGTLEYGRGHKRNSAVSADAGLQNASDDVALEKEMLSKTWRRIFFRDVDSRALATCWTAPRLRTVYLNGDGHHYVGVDAVTGVAQVLLTELEGVLSGRSALLLSEGDVPCLVRTAYQLEWALSREIQAIAKNVNFGLGASSSSRGG